MKAETLKKAILQYAMQGKLVEQDPNDEPASVLLERIKVEKEQLIKDGKIKKEKPLPPITEDEIPFEIPTSWEWIRIGNIFQHNTGKALNSKDVCGIKCKYITTSNLYWDKFELNNLREMYFSESEIEKCTAQKGDLLVLEGGDIGRAAIWKYDYGICIQNHIHRLRPYKTVCTKFFYYLFLLYKLNLFIGGKGIGIQGLSSNAIHIIPFPFPPLAEQQRIVEKLEEILPLVDEYGKNEEKLSKLNSTLPDKIKQSILQYAVQGKLVPQDPNDEPASVLLARIKAEKEQLIKDGKIKKEKPIPPIAADELPFEIPKGWGIARLGSIIEIARGGSPRPIQDYLTTSPNGLNWIKIGDSDKGGKYINSTKEKITKEGLNKTRYVRKGDFLLSNSMSFGRPYILSIDGCIHDGWLVLSNIEKCFNKDFLYYLLSSYYIYQQFCGSVSGAVVKNLNTDKVSNAVVCIPPLAEQHRIVTKVEELLSIVDNLKV